MSIGDRTYRYQKWTSGSLRLKNIYNNVFGYTETRKEVAAASNTAVLAATAATVTADKTITSGITNPDVPRALKVVPAGTTDDILDSSVRITGTNVEGKTITEQFSFANAATAATEGNLAFKTVTTIVFDGQESTNAQFSVGYTNKLGVNHRLYNQNTTVVVYSYTGPGEPGGKPTTLTKQAAPTVVARGDNVESNLVTPATAPDGTTAYTIAYNWDYYATDPLNDEPEYSTSTSTSSTSSSTSTTTGTTTSTSTSSTSSSTSSTSTSSTSSSTSSTSSSTSTTTVP